MSKALSHITSASWGEENKTFSYWMGSIFLLSLLVEITVILGNGYPFLESFFAKDVLLSNFGLLLIPYSGFNAVVWAKKHWIKGKLSSIKSISLKMIALVVGVLLATAIVEGIGYSIAYEDDDYIVLGTLELSPSASNFIENILMALLIGLPIFYIQSLKDQLAWKLHDKEQELDELYQLKLESELAAIHAKINPHFLYNSLNSIVCLIHDNPDKAEEMVFGLSDLFRYSINSSDNHFASVSEEVRLIQTYMDLELVRFQDQLQFECKVDPALQSIEIPKFLIQPLVENAIKHGTSKCTKGQILVEIQKEDKDLRISVFDNGPHFASHSNEGYGLRSCIDKLDILYQNDYDFQLINTPKKQVKILLKQAFNHDT